MDLAFAQPVTDILFGEGSTELFGEGAIDWLVFTKFYFAI